MFSLIITIVSIALVVALVAATMYYGGDTLTEGRTRADAAAFVSGGQQVAGALQLYNAMEASPATDIADLIPKYLTGIPVVKGTELEVNAGDKTITSIVDSDDVCTAINVSAGYSDADTVTDVTGTYGCNTSNNQFVFKY